MSVFGWQQQHVDWFLKTFGRETKELTGRDVEKRYAPKKGEPKKGKSQNGEDTISMQDFRHLMRIMVRLRRARVVKGHVRSKHYRIRMVDADYPFIQNVFGEEIFCIPKPDKEELLSMEYPTLKRDWDEKVQTAWASAIQQSQLHLCGFKLINDYGGDFDLLFDELQGYSEELKAIKLFMEQLLGDNDRELFALEIHFFVLLHEAFRIGNEELLPYVKLYGDDYQPEDPDRFFVDVFETCLRDNFFGDFLQRIELPKLNADRTIYDNSLKVLESCRKLTEASTSDEKRYYRDNIREDMLIVTNGYVPSEEAQRQFNHGDGKGWRELLAKSDRPELIEALAKAKEAYQVRETFKVRMLRPQGNKNLGNASVNESGS
jgi:hypothetical protein